MDPPALTITRSNSRIRSSQFRDLPPLTDLSPSAQAVKGCRAVLTDKDSSAYDRFRAIRILVFLTLEDPSSSLVAWWIALTLVFAILINCTAFLIGSLKTFQYQPTTCVYPVCVPGPGSLCTETICHPKEEHVCWEIEFWTIIMFTVDYLLRMLSVHAVPADLICARSLDYTVDGRLKNRNYQERHGFLKTIRYFFGWLNIIDLVSILPFFIHMAYAKEGATADDLAVLRVLRLLRVVRIFKLGRYSEGGVLLWRTLRASLPALILFVFLTTIITIVFGSLMYYFEMGTFTVTIDHPHGVFLRLNNRATEVEVSPFGSILMGMYWVVVNTTTLGNCALYPTTVLGRILSCIVAYCGILSIALPISIVGKNFTEQYNLIYGKSGGAWEGKSRTPTPSMSRQNSSRRMVLRRSNSGRSGSSFVFEGDGNGRGGISDSPARLLPHPTALSGTSLMNDGANSPAPAVFTMKKSHSLGSKEGLLTDEQGNGVGGGGRPPSYPPSSSANTMLMEEMRKALASLQAEVSSLRGLETEVVSLRAQVQSLQGRGGATGGQQQQQQQQQQLRLSSPVSR